MPIGFTITAVTYEGERCQYGGETFLIAVRGAARARARVTDFGDGTYGVSWKPECSGSYQIAAALQGKPPPPSRTL